MSYNRLMVKNVQYNGLSFLNTPFGPKEWFLCLKEFSFFEVATSASTEKYAITHGEYVSPTLKKNRRIRFLFDIIAPDEKRRWGLLKQVQRAFTPETNPSPFNPKLRKPLTFEDVNDEVWTCNCQVINGVQLSDFANEKRVGISVELITDSSDFKSITDNTATWRNTRRGKKFWFATPKHPEYFRDIIEYEGVIDGPVTITMEMIEENALELPKITFVQTRNNKESYFQIDVSDLTLAVGDKLQIDSDKRRLYLIQNGNKRDITGLVVLGSNRPLLKLWENIFSIDTGAKWKKIEIEYVRKNLF